MPTKTFDINHDIETDSLAENISNKWLTWLNARAPWEERYRKVLQYLYSSTTDTIYGQASNPWNSNVHIPKLTQLRDVLITYELESLFSLSDYYTFEGFTQDSNTLANRNVIKALLKNMLDEGGFKGTIEKLVADYIDAGNCFVMPIWESQKVEDAAGFKSIFWEGVKALRINPLDIVFDPTASEFKDSPKIIRTVLSLGELALQAEEDPIMKKGFDKAMKIRQDIMTAMTNGDTIKGDEITIAGFGNWSAYVSSDVVELLTFYGTVYDVVKKELHKNKKIVIMDRRVLLIEEDMEDLNGYDFIFKSGYRDRKDILWSMSPLENLLGMQARIDFLENKRSDCYDATVNPVRVIKGNVDMPDALGPGDEIRMDVDCDVHYLAPDTSILTADTLMDRYEYKMEEIAGAPKEVLGFRTPGEKTMFEVNQLMTAATRIYQRQIRKFEREMMEPILNAMLQMYLKKKAGQTISLKFWDSKEEVYTFKDVPVDDINSLGRIVVFGTEVAQDKAKVAQALQMLGQNPLFLDEVVRNNFSPAELGKVFSYVTGLDRFNDLFKKDARLYEITDQQKLIEKLSGQVDEVKAESLASASENADSSEIYNRLTQERVLGADENVTE